MSGQGITAWVAAPFPPPEKGQRWAVGDMGPVGDLVVDRWLEDLSITTSTPLFAAGS